MQNMVPIMEPFIPIVINNASGNIKHTAWCIVLDPAAQNRPAVEFGVSAASKLPNFSAGCPTRCG